MIRKTILTVALATTMTAFGTAHAEEAGIAGIEHTTLPVDIEWQDTPEFPGLKVVVLQGDPSKPGIYIMRAKFEPGFMTKPHYHTKERYVTVISGIWWAVTGDTETPETTVPLAAGSYMVHPADEVHFDGAKHTGAVVEIVGMGPVETFYVDPAAD